MAKDGVSPDIADGLRRMNFEEKMAEARERRAKVLAERSKVRAVVPLAKTLETAPTEPVLVLDDAYQVRGSEAPEVVGDLTYGPELSNTLAPPLFHSVRSDQDGENDHNTAGSVLIALAAILTALTFSPGLGLRGTPAEALAGAGPEQPAPPVVEDIAAAAPLIATATLVTKFEASPIETAITQADLALPLAPEQIQAFAATAPESPVTLAGAPDPITAVLPVLTVALADPGALTSQSLVVRVIVPEDVPKAETTRVVDEIGRTHTAELDAIAEVDFRVSATHVRYYHPTDRNKAEDFAREIGGEARDFSGARVLDRSGYLEVYIKGAGAPAATTAQNERAIDKILDDVLRRN